MKKHILSEFKGQFFKILETTDRSQVGVMTVAPGSDSGPEEVHDGDQIIYVIEGEATLEVNRKKGTLSEGECAVIPEGSQHHIYNNGDTPLFFLTLYAPPQY